jgi:hypothetical protein
VAFRGDRGEIVNDLALVPYMIAGSKDVGAEVEEIFGNGRRQSEAAGGVLRIHDHQVDLALLNNVGQMLPYHPPPWTAENVPDKEQFHEIHPSLK